MNEAVKESFLAINSKEGEPFGCVIVKDGKIVAGGHNRMFIDNDPTAHGEVSALRNAGKILKN